MAGVFGNLNLNDMIGKISDQFQKVVPNDAFPTAQLGSGDPFGSIGLGGGGDPFGGIGFGAGGDPFGGFQQNQNDPFPQAQIGGKDPFGTFNLSQNDPFGQFSMGNTNPFGSFGMPADPWAGRIQTTPTPTEIAKVTPNTSAPGQQGGMTFAGPATSDDNKDITGAQVDQFIASKFGNSPMVGQGQYILDTANKYGISAMLLLGIGWKESGMGTNVGRGNIFGMKDGPDSWIKYGNTQAEIDAAARNLSGANYKGRSAADQLSMWYIGKPYAGNGGAVDSTGGKNGTVDDYLNQFIAPTYAAFGKGLNPTQAPTQRSVPVTAEGYAFPVVGYSQANVPLHWGSEHGGADIFAPEGTSVVAMGSGTVIDAGTNSLGGNTVTLRLDNGMTVYMAHLRDAPLVRAGQKVQAGSALGFVGQTGNAAGTGAHLHIGIGNGIVNGGGPTGGLGDGFGPGGSSFDANGWLNSILNQSRGGR